MYYLVKIRFESQEDSGKIKKTREHFLVEADTIGEAEKITIDRFGTGLSECFLESIQESKILDVIFKS